MLFIRVQLTVNLFPAYKSDLKSFGLVLAQRDPFRQLCAAFYDAPGKHPRRHGGMQVFWGYLGSCIGLAVWMIQTLQFNGEFTSVNQPRAQHSSGGSRRAAAAPHARLCHTTLGVGGVAPAKFHRRPMCPGCIPQCRCHSHGVSAVRPRQIDAKYQVTHPACIAAAARTTTPHGWQLSSALNSAPCRFKHPFACAAWQPSPLWGGECSIASRMGAVQRSRRMHASLHMVSDAGSF